jgi:hypothetical protein
MNQGKRKSAARENVRWDTRRRVWAAEMSQCDTKWTDDADRRRTRVPDKGEEQKEKLVCFAENVIAHDCADLGPRRTRHTSLMSVTVWRKFFLLIAATNPLTEPKTEVAAETTAPEPAPLRSVIASSFAV